MKFDRTERAAICRVICHPPTPLCSPLIPAQAASVGRLAPIGNGSYSWENICIHTLVRTGLAVRETVPTSAAGQDGTCLADDTTTVTSESSNVSWHETNLCVGLNG